MGVVTDSPIFTPPASNLLQGLNVSIWYPLPSGNFSSPSFVAEVTKKWALTFGRFARLDALFVPGGDPGPRAKSVCVCVCVGMSTLQLAQIFCNEQCTSGNARQEILRRI